MNPLVARGNLMVLYGYVIEVCTESFLMECEITTEGSMCKKDKVRVRTTQHIKNGFKPFCNVICSTSSAFPLEIIADGGEVLSDKEIEVEGKIIRYTGSFDFEEYEIYPEKHVFCGYIKNVGKQKNGSLIDISWTHSGEEIYRRVWFPLSKPDDLVPSLPVIISAGSKKEIKGVEIYNGTEIIRI